MDYDHWKKIVSKCAVRGLIKYPGIKESPGPIRTARIQEHAALLHPCLDTEERAIALGIGYKEFTEALQAPKLPMDVFSPSS